MRLLLLLLGMLLLGCAKDVTKEIEGLADRACACADKQDVACGKTVLGEFVKLAAESRNVKGDEAKAAAAAKRFGECLLRSGVTSVEISTAVNQLKKEEPAPPPAPAPAGSAEAPAGSATPEAPAP
jgi:hypothetical protein